MRFLMLRLLFPIIFVCQLASYAHAGTVNLAWDANLELDLAGYNVYRSQTSGSGYSRLNGALVLSPSYSDNTASIGPTYYYVVTAVNTLALESGYSNEVPTAVTGVPDLALSKSHSGNFTVGTNGVYTLTVSNVGSAATTGAITVTDTLPTGFSFVSGSGTAWSCSASGQTVTCANSGPLASGASSSITLTVAVAAAAVPAVTNTASVSTPGDTNPANNSASNPTVVNAVVVLSIGQSSNAATPGTQVSLPVTLSDGNGIARLQFILNYDPAIFSYPSGASPTAGTLINGHSISANGSTPGKVSIVLAGSNSLRSGPGTVVLIPLVVNSQATSGTQTPLALSDVSAFNQAGGSVSLQTQGGTLTITNNLPCPGDVNLDGLRNVADAVLILNHIVGKQLLTGQALINADVNGDGQVNVADVIRLLNHIVGNIQLSPCL